MYGVVYQLFQVFQFAMVCVGGVGCVYRGYTGRCGVLREAICCCCCCCCCRCCCCLVVVFIGNGRLFYHFSTFSAASLITDPPSRLYQATVSILSGRGSSQNYRGLLNLMAILLLVTNSRLIAANLRRYGVLASMPRMHEPSDLWEAPRIAGTLFLVRWRCRRGRRELEVRGGG